MRFSIVNHDKIKRVFCLLMIPLLILVLSCSHNLYAETSEDRRAWVGIDLFPSLLAADKDITEKKGDHGYLILGLVYSDRKALAEEIGRYMEKVGYIRGIPIKVEIIRTSSLEKATALAGIFLCEPVTNGLDQIINYVKKEHIIIFSPFWGDVERGVSGGMLISDKITPYLNLKSIKQSKIQIKPFFLRIAKKYE